MKGEYGQLTTVYDCGFFMPIFTYYYTKIKETKGKHMKRPLAYISSAWGKDEPKDRKRAAKYCREVYSAGFAPVCPMLTHSLFLDTDVPEEHKDGIDMARELLRRSHVLVICGDNVDESVKSDIAIAERLRITATTLDGILTVKEQGRK